MCFRVRLQSTTARYISVGIWYKHKARFAWVSSAWLGFIKVHIKYNGICGARCYLAPRLYIWRLWFIPHFCQFSALLFIFFMSALIFINAKKLSALIFLVHEKWVGLNILCESALIFSALRTGSENFISITKIKTIYLPTKTKPVFKREKESDRFSVT